LHGEERPKQFAMIHRGHSLLQATVARAASWSAPERTVVVVAAEREGLARAQLRGYCSVDIVAQPSNRGTGPGILLPLARVHARDPGARVVVLPSDHYVRDARPFELSVERAAAASNEQIHLIGAVPDRPETQYGWIVPGRELDGSPALVTRFWEKPPAVVARRLYREGALWNTFIMAGHVGRFWQLGRDLLPAQLSLFDVYRQSIGSGDEGRVLQGVYSDMPAADFSRDVLQRAAGLRVVPLHECGWSDWGTN